MGGDANTLEGAGAAVPEVPIEVFRHAVEQAALAISITDAHAHILYANQAFRRVTGYALEEVTGHKESILSYKVTPKIVYETMWAQLLRQRPWNGLLVNRRRDGSRYLAELTITPVLDAAGLTTHYLGMHRDVTEVHRLERQVQNQKTLIESVVDAAQVAIVVLDESERIVLDNHEYKKLIGELGDEPLAAILAALRQAMGGAFDESRRSRRGFAGRELAIETRARRSRWFTCSGSWIDEHDASADAFYEPQRHQYLLLTLQDITALKEQQEAIRVNGLRALLAEQERIQGLREVMFGTIYQLRGPFNMLAAAVRLLERNGEPQPDGALVASLTEALAAGEATLETLHASVPAEADEASQAVDLNELIRDVLRIAAARMLAEGLVVEWQPDPVLPPVPGRLRQLSTLFKQLLDNAVEAIHDARGNRRELRVATLAHADHVEVVVEDSGPGIPEEWRLKVFQPFFTTKGADRQHIGMGLTLAQEIVARHGGLIELEPGARGGCRVSLRLPLGA